MGKSLPIALRKKQSPEHVGLSFHTRGLLVCHSVFLFEFVVIPGYCTPIDDKLSSSGQVGHEAPKDYDRGYRTVKGPFRDTCWKGTSYPFAFKWAQATEARKGEFDDRLFSIQNALKLTMGEVGVIISQVGKHDLFSTEEVS